MLTHDICSSAPFWACLHFFFNIRVKFYLYFKAGKPIWTVVFPNLNETSIKMLIGLYLVTHNLCAMLCTFYHKLNFRKLELEPSCQILSFRVLIEFWLIEFMQGVKANRYIILNISRTFHKWNKEIIRMILKYKNILAYSIWQTVLWQNKKMYLCLYYYLTTVTTILCNFILSHD